MFVIRPVENFCVLCGITFDETCIAYAAHVNDAFAGICQFRVGQSYGCIRDISSLPDNFNRNILFLLGRASMNFIYHCGPRFCQCRTSAGRSELLADLSFSPGRGGLLFADLSKIFDNTVFPAPYGKKRKGSGFLPE